MHLMLATRPDIAYAVTKLAQFAAIPTNRHWTGVLKIIRYLRVTAHHISRDYGKTQCMAVQCGSALDVAMR